MVRPLIVVLIAIVILAADGLTWSLQGPRSNVVLSPSVAEASNTCSSFANTYAGGADASQSTWGAVANIDTRSASFCTTGDPTSGDEISTWSMTQGPYGYFAQAGYLKAYSGGPTSWTEFGEYNDVGGCGCFSHTQKLWNATSNGENHMYWEQYDSATGRESMNVDGSQIFETNYNPQGNWGSNWKASFMGENDNLGDDMPGSSSTPTNFSGLMYWPGYNTSTSIGSFTFGTDGFKSFSTPCFYHTSKVAVDHFQLWTAGC